MDKVIEGLYKIRAVAKDDIKKPIKKVLSVGSFQSELLAITKLIRYKQNIDTKIGRPIAKAITTSFIKSIFWKILFANWYKYQRGETRKAKGPRIIIIVCFNVTLEKSISAIKYYPLLNI
jgi:hypothetical protein